MQPTPLSVLTWNINFRAAESLDPLAALSTLPDVVTLQEVKLDHADAVKDRLKDSALMASLTLSPRFEG